MNTPNATPEGVVSKSNKKPLMIVLGALFFISALTALVTAVEFGAPSSVAAAFVGYQTTTPAITNNGVLVTPGANVTLGTFTLEPSTPPPFYDFLVPDVCLDAGGSVTSEDPAKCTKKRNLRIGESLPYILADYAAAPGWQQSYIYANSFPVIKGKDIRVVQTREWGANSGHPDGAFRDFGPLDAYDIMSSNGQYVSSIGTRDPIMNNAGFYWAQPDCSLKDSWILFPIGLKKGEESYTVAKLLGGYLPCKPSPDAYSTSMTTWNWYSYPLPYSSGKSLESIQSWHHSGTDPNDATKALDAMEVFRLTKEYGLTRWEGWVTATSTVAELMGWETAEEVADVVKLHKASKQCDAGDPLDRFGYIMSRWGCADFSYVFAPDPKRGPVNPYSMPIVKEFVTSRNLISADESKARSDAAGGSLLGWKTLGLGGGRGPKLDAGSDPKTSTNISTASNPTPGNFFYRLACTDSCGVGNPRSMYVDVNPATEVSAYGTGALKVQVGGLVRGPEKAMDATLAVHMMDAKGAIIESRTVSLMATSTYRNAITGFATTTATTSPARLNVQWGGASTFKNIPYGSQVLIGRNVYTTISDTTVGLIYLSATTTGLKVGDPIKHIQGPDGKVIYNDVGATSDLSAWKQVRFNFDWDFTAKPVANIRYELYVRSPGAYHLDEAFIALLPRN